MSAASIFGTVNYPERLMCVWECRSPSSPEVVRVIANMHDDDATWVREYQRIVYRGPLSGYVAAPVSR